MERKNSHRRRLTEKRTEESEEESIDCRAYIGRRNHPLRHVMPGRAATPTTCEPLPVRRRCNSTTKSRFANLLFAQAFHGSHWRVESRSSKPNLAFLRATLVMKGNCANQSRLPAPIRLPGPLRSNKRDDVRHHAIRVGVGQAVCGILVHNQLAAGDEFVSRAPVRLEQD